MVELKLEALDLDLSSQYYVSLRVGEVQKLSRISASRAYNFPAKVVGNRKFGKIEIFKKIGGCSVGIIPEDGVDQEVSVSLDDDRRVKFKVGLNAEAGKSAPVKLAPEKALGQDVNPKVQAAKAYLEEHNLEMRLSEAMQEVLREKPTDPAAFLAKTLAKSASVVLKTPKNEEKVAGQSAPEAPPKSASPAPAMSKSVPPQANAAPGVLPTATKSDDARLLAIVQGLAIAANGATNPIIGAGLAMCAAGTAQASIASHLATAALGAAQKGSASAPGLVKMATSAAIASVVAKKMVLVQGLADAALGATDPVVGAGLALSAAGTAQAPMAVALATAALGAARAGSASAPGLVKMAASAAVAAVAA